MFNLSINFNLFLNKISLWKSKSSIEPSFIFYPSDEDKINENFYIFIKIIGTVKNQDFKNFLFFSTNNFNDKNYISK